MQRHARMETSLQGYKEMQILRHRVCSPPPILAWCRGGKSRLEIGKRPGNKPPLSRDRLTHWCRDHITALRHGRILRKPSSPSRPRGLKENLEEGRATQKRHNLCVSNSHMGRSASGRQWTNLFDRLFVSGCQMCRLCTNHPHCPTAQPGQNESHCSVARVGNVDRHISWLRR